MLKIKNTGIKTRFLNPLDEFWDRRIGVRTFGFKPAVGTRDSADFRVHYEPTPYKKIFRIFNEIGLDEKDCFLDIGSGMGRVVFAASWLGARRSIGVEIDKELIATAKENLRRSRLKDRDIQFICSPAQGYHPHDVTVIYMFHPFGPGTMKSVLELLKESIDENPRKIRLAYDNPVHSDIINATELFRMTKKWPAEGTKAQRYDTMFWESL